MGWAVPAPLSQFKVGYALHQAAARQRAGPTPIMPENTSAPRVVLITGAASGIGAALARQLAREGAHLALHARDRTAQARMTTLVRECRDAGAVQCAVLYAELGSEAAARTLIDETHSTFGALDQVVSNAGYAHQGGVTDSSWSSLERAFAVMPATFAMLTRFALPFLEQSRRASIVALSSFVAHSYRADRLFAETAAAKAALEALARSAALELAPRGITVNCVVPGFTRKDRPPDPENAEAWRRASGDTPTGRVAEPDEVAAAIRFLLGLEARQITGALLHVDGGLTSR